MCAEVVQRPDRHHLVADFFHLPLNTHHQVLRLQHHAGRRFHRAGQALTQEHWPPGIFAQLGLQRFKRHQAQGLLAVVNFHLFGTCVLEPVRHRGAQGLGGQGSLMQVKRRAGTQARDDPGQGDVEPLNIGHADGCQHAGRIPPVLATGSRHGAIFGAESQGQTFPCPIVQRRQLALVNAGQQADLLPHRRLEPGIQVGKQALPDHVPAQPRHVHLHSARRRAGGGGGGVGGLCCDQQHPGQRPRRAVGQFQLHAEQPSLGWLLECLEHVVMVSLPPMTLAPLEGGEPDHQLAGLHGQALLGFRGPERFQRLAEIGRQVDDHRVEQALQVHARAARHRRVVAPAQR